MKNRLMEIALTHSNLLIVMRAKGALRIRYGIHLPKRTPDRDPIWLSAHD